MLWFLVTTTGYLYYIQFSPSMGNIWIRCGEFIPYNALNLMMYPFKNISMWKPELWAINYPIWLFVGFTLSKSLDYIIKNTIKGSSNDIST